MRSLTRTREPVGNLGLGTLGYRPNPEPHHRSKVPQEVEAEPASITWEWETPSRTDLVRSTGTKFLSVVIPSSQLLPPPPAQSGNPERWERPVGVSGILKLLYEFLRWPILVDREALACSFDREGMVELGGGP